MDRTLSLCLYINVAWSPEIPKYFYGTHVLIDWYVSFLPTIDCHDKNTGKPANSSAVSDVVLSTLQFIVQRVICSVKQHVTDFSNNATNFLILLIY